MLSRARDAGDDTRMLQNGNEKAARETSRRSNNENPSMLMRIRTMAQCAEVSKRCQLSTGRFARRQTEKKRDDARNRRCYITQRHYVQARHD